MTDPAPLQTAVEPLASPAFLVTGALCPLAVAAGLV